MSEPTREDDCPDDCAGYTLRCDPCVIVSRLDATEKERDELRAQLTEAREGWKQWRAKRWYEPQCDGYFSLRRVMEG
jgi:hypothetical protein